MNILDIAGTALGKPGVFKGSWPAQPDSALGLFEYSGPAPEQHFGGMNEIEAVQLRSRDLNPTTAYANAKAAALILNRYHDDEISILQSTPILDIGKDDNNPPRQEYTVNFEIRRY